MDMEGSPPKNIQAIDVGLECWGWGLTVTSEGPEDLPAPACHAFDGYELGHVGMMWLYRRENA